MDKELTIEITKKEYESLLEDRRWLRALEKAGVDNWEGYDIAVEYYTNKYGPEEED